jgi:hypothetical protein
LTLVRLQKIDDLHRGLHYYLEDHHKCFFLREYTSNRDFNYGETNNLISNLKKEMHKAGGAEWRYKLQAINRFARELNGVIPSSIAETAVFVPMPPSKVREDPAYDPRLIQILESTNRLREDPLRICDCISEVENRESAHSIDSRRTPPDEKLESLRVDRTQLPRDVRTVVVFDDMITTGSSFAAVERLLRGALPDTDIIGLFLARRIFPPAAEDFDAINLEDLF